jgi:hypothetical protein
LIGVPLCISIGTCLNGVHPKDVSSGMPLFGGDYMEN